MMGVGGELDGVFAAHQTPLVVVLGSPDDLGGYKDGLALASMTSPYVPTAIPAGYFLRRKSDTPSFSSSVAVLIRRMFIV
jgi:hypothetical protein